MRALFAALAMIAGFGVWILSLGIYLLTLYIAYLSGFVQMLLTLIFPVAAQIYWIFNIWYLTGTFLNTLTVLCLVWVVLLISTFAFSQLSEKQ
jgi:hypothetical protein